VFSSLRVRLPLIFLGGIVLAGLVTTAIAIQLFQSFAHDQTLDQLRNEANGIAQLYSNAVKATFDTSNAQDSRRAPTFARANLELATGDRIYYDGVNPFPGEKSGLRQLNLTTIDWTSGRELTFEFTPPGLHHTYLAVAHPVDFGKNRAIGAIIVAKRKTDVSSSVLALIERLAVGRPAVIDLGAGADALEPAIVSILTRLVVVAGGRASQLQATFSARPLVRALTCATGLVVVGVDADDAALIATRAQLPFLGSVPADAYLARDEFATRAPTMRSIDRLIRSL